MISVKPYSRTWILISWIKRFLWASPEVCTCCMETLDKCRFLWCFKWVKWNYVLLDSLDSILMFFIVYFVNTIDIYLSQRSIKINQNISPNKEVLIKINILTVFDHCINKTAINLLLTLTYFENKLIWLNGKKNSSLLEVQFKTDTNKF